MYRSIEDFLTDWRVESASTLKLLRVLTDESLAVRVDPEGKTLGELAWHIAASPVEMMKMAGLAIDAAGDDAPVPAEAAGIADQYERVAAELAARVGEAWTDGMLGDEINVFGQTWTLSFLLAVLLRHQTHHRGQLTVLARAAGLRIPGVCGPTREEMAEIMARFGEELGVRS